MPGRSFLIPHLEFPTTNLTVLNYIWLGLVLAGVLLGAVTGQIAEVTQAAFDSAELAVLKIALPLVGIMAFWLGIMRLAEKSGLVAILARLLRPVLTRIFPEVPASHPAMGSMLMNIAANMLGLANAATPLGLRAMQDLEKLNPRPGTATNAMVTFLAINTSSVQLIPATTVAYLVAAGSTNPTAIIGPAFAATLCSTIVAITAVKFLEKLPTYRLPPIVSTDDAPAVEAHPDEEPPPPIRSWGVVALAALAIVFAAVSVVMVLAPEAFASFANNTRAALGLTAEPFAFPDRWLANGYGFRAIDTISLLAIPLVLAFFPLFAAARSIPVYEEFVEGAKEGFHVAIRIIPFLVAILVAIGMFRAAGGIDLIAKALGPFLQAVGFPVELLPLTLMRPLSGGGASGIFNELIREVGPDSLIAQMASCIMGSTETTFYVIAVYFGSVAVRRTRHAVPAGLLADATGVIASIIVCRWMFG